MSNDWKLVSEGYLYNLWRGKLAEVKGEIWRKDKYKEGYTISPAVTYFRVIDERGRCVKKLTCSEIEEKVCNKGVWLAESNRVKAAKLLIDYEEQQIAELEFKIKNHKDLIETLNEELES